MSKTTTPQPSCQRLKLSEHCPQNMKQIRAGICPNERSALAFVVIFGVLMRAERFPHTHAFSWNLVRRRDDEDLLACKQALPMYMCIYIYILYIYIYDYIFTVHLSNLRDLPTYCTSIGPFIYLSTDLCNHRLGLFSLSLYQSVFLCLWLAFCRSLSVSVSLTLSISLSLSLSICLPLCLSIRPSIHPPIHVHVLAAYCRILDRSCSFKTLVDELGRWKHAHEARLLLPDPPDAL